MNEESYNKLLKQALVLETKERTAFLNDIDDEQIKSQLQRLLSDDSLLTEFVVKTAVNVPLISQAEARELVAGDKIKQFLIKKLIAKGGMGSVFLAYDEKLKRNVAIKSIRAEFRHSEDSQKRFEKEAQILSQINHPAICQIYDCIEYQGGDLLVLELVDGKTLNQVELNELQMLEVLIQLASALNAAHEKGVIHRDLKPDNIMLTSEGKLKILDFGIAKSQQSPDFNNSSGNTSIAEDSNLTKAGSLMGTLTYMSPEQAATDENISSASDIYSVAVIMYQMLTGALPYRFDNTQSLLQQIIEARIIDSNTLPNEFEALIQSMTCKSPEFRPSALELKNALIEIKNRPQYQKQKRKNLIIFSMITVLSAVLLGVFYLYWNQQRKSDFLVDTYAKINQASQIIEKAYTLPLHNVVSELQQAQASIENLNIEHISYLSSGEKALLKGQAFYAIGDYTQAIPWLQLAWDQGYQTIELAEKMATALVSKYWQDHFTNDDNKDDSESYRFQNMRSKQELLSKATEYFRWIEQHGRSEDLDLDLIDAYNLFATSEYAQALDTLDLHRARREGDYIKFNLLGNIYWELYGIKFQSKEFEEAKDLLQKSISAFEEAIQYGRSYQDSYINLCNVRIEHFENAIYENWEDQPELFQSTYQSCEKATRIDPRKSFSYNKITELLSRYMDFLLESGKDVSPHLHRALEWNQKALALEPSPYAYKMKAFLYDVVAVQKINAGESPLEDIDIAMQAYQKAIDLRPRLLAKNATNILYTWIRKVEYMLAHGQNILPEVQAAEQLFLKAVESKLDTKVENMYMYVSLGVMLNYMAQYEWMAEGEPLKWLQKSNDVLKQVLHVPKNTAFVRSGILENQLLKARILFQREMSIDRLPEGLLEDIEQRVNDLDQELSPYYWFQWIKFDLHKLKYKMNTENSDLARTHLQQMQSLMQQSIDSNPRDSESYLKLAEAYLLQLNDAHSKELQTALQKGLEALKSSQERNPYSAKLHWLKALFLQQAEMKQLNQSIFSESVEELKARALKINPLIANDSFD